MSEYNKPPGYDDVYGEFHPNHVPFLPQLEDDAAHAADPDLVCACEAWGTGAI